ncbi:MAG: cytochrome b/b6 domain-containing protein [Rhodobacteraceae bacterium]|nr:cytochrome b/b6 domain-containing protein [Paracoccaceae bacterium]
MQNPQATPDSFSRLQRLLHWSMVALLALNLIVPQRMWALEMTLWGRSMSGHMAIGSVIFLLAVLRFFIRLGFGVPDEPLGAPRFFRGLARLGQWMFYALFFATPILGIWAYQTGDAQVLWLHRTLLPALFWMLIPVHVGLALAHQFLWRTDMLGKIIRG